ncbi:MAG: S8 family serine peptidase [Pseudomonadota bacterium]
MKRLSTLVLLGISKVAFSSVISVIDSGLDVKHPKLMEQVWSNPREISFNDIDDDQNGFIDDLNGWNFAENSNRLIDMRFLKTYTPEVKRFFDIQLKGLSGTLDADDKEWLKTKFDDKDFMANLMKFGNFAHGTHVAGISAARSLSNKIMGIKLIPTESPMATTLNYINRIQGESKGKKTKEAILRQGLTFLASQQAQLFVNVGSYGAKLGAQTANCSFGMNSLAARNIVAPLLKLLFGGDVEEATVVEYANFMVNEVVRQGQSMALSNPKTLFVFAAGNDGTDNEIYPIAPANIREQNTMTVAATYNDGRIAKFSNFSRELVDVAAPGVGIVSTIPGGETITMSGTSQAAPFVAGVAAGVQALNPALTPSAVKAILMGTVDKIDLLYDKVVSGGVVNAERAFAAASFSKDHALDQAMELAHQKVKASVRGGAFYDADFDPYVVPLLNSLGSN